MSIQYTDVDDPATIRRVRGMLMPGYVIIERRDILKQEMENGTNGLDALLDYTKVNMSARKDENGKLRDGIFREKAQAGSSRSL